MAGTVQTDCDLHNMSMDLHLSRLWIPVRGLHYTLHFVSLPSVSAPDWVEELTVSINQFRLHETTACQQISLSLWTPLSGAKREDAWPSVDTVHVTIHLFFNIIVDILSYILGIIKNQKRATCFDWTNHITNLYQDRKPVLDLFFFSWGFKIVF